MEKASIFPLFLFVFSLMIYPVHASTSVEVGVYYYVWYDPSTPVSWEYPKIHDQPILGFYNSCDSEIIKQHFAWMSELHIDFAILSWWGINHFTDNASKQVFEVAKENVTNVKLCVMIEPYNETEDGYNYSQLYDHVYDAFVSPYPTVYYQYGHYDAYGTYFYKPLLLFYNGAYLTPNEFPKDDRFTILVVGHSDYANWIYEDVRKTYADYPWPNEPIPRERQVSILPRFDDYYVRSPNYTIDSKLEWLYDSQWKRALDYAQKGKVNLVTIVSWNEYPERTAIEPHYDSTAVNRDPYFLFSKTEQYIAELKGIKTDSELWYNNPRTYAITAGVIIFIAIIGKYVYDKA
jgi:hypothetical protein